MTWQDLQNVDTEMTEFPPDLEMAIIEWLQGFGFLLDEAVSDDLSEALEWFASLPESSYALVQNLSQDDGSIRAFLKDGERLFRRAEAYL
jgi:hypothetical protein